MVMGKKRPMATTRMLECRHWELRGRKQRFITCNQKEKQTGINTAKTATELNCSLDRTRDRLFQLRQELRGVQRYLYTASK